MKNFLKLDLNKDDQKIQRNKLFYKLFKCEIISFCTITLGKVMWNEYCEFKTMEKAMTNHLSFPINNDNSWIIMNMKKNTLLLTHFHLYTFQISSNVSQNLANFEKEI